MPRWGKLKRIYIGGVKPFCTQLSLEHSASPEWLPRWGQTVVASVGSGWFVYLVIASK